MQDRGDVGGSNGSQLQVPATVRWESSSGVTVRGSLKLMARSWNTFRQGCWCGAGSQIGTSIRRIRRQSGGDRKSTRLNSSHGYISYAVFCLKKKKSHYAHATQ